VIEYNWLESRADHATVWTSHVLRREAEAMILPNLSAFLKGTHQPLDTDERLALLGVCQSRNLYGTTARLYADAFAADPGLAERLTADCLARAELESDLQNYVEVLHMAPRYLAARCAALAGCGLGNDGAKLTDAERTRWRVQARAWLQADLAALIKTEDSTLRQPAKLAKQMLTLWQTDPDLARLREPVSLQDLPSEERLEWTSLWHEIAVALRELSVAPAAPGAPSMTLGVEDSIK
jgi:serine/threonine-protein kinase